jgi:hypothetical protein
VIWGNTASNQAPRGWQALDHVDFKDAIFARKILESLRSKVASWACANNCNLELQQNRSLIIWIEEVTLL